MVIAVGAVKAECWSLRRCCLTCCFGLCCVCAQLPSPRQKRAWPRAGAHCGMETCWDVKQSKYSGLFFRLGSFLHKEERITSAQGRQTASGQASPVLYSSPQQTAPTCFLLPSHGSLNYMFLPLKLFFGWEKQGNPCLNNSARWFEGTTFRGQLLSVAASSYGSSSTAGAEAPVLSPMYLHGPDSMEKSLNDVIELYQHFGLVPFQLFQFQLLYTLPKYHTVTHTLLIKFKSLGKVQPLRGWSTACL